MIKMIFLQSLFLAKKPQTLLNELAHYDVEFVYLDFCALSVRALYSVL